MFPTVVVSADVVMWAPLVNVPPCSSGITPGLPANVIVNACTPVMVCASATVVSRDTTLLSRPVSAASRPGALSAVSCVIANGRVSRT